MDGKSLRPETWDQYIGQEQLKEHLQIKIAGALRRGKPLDDVLLFGDPGVGKTSLAYLIAKEMGETFDTYIQPIKPQILRKIVQTTHGVVLLDELHSMPAKMQESLLSVLEDGYLQLDSGAKIPKKNLTFIGATTEANKVIAPLWDRFTIKPCFDPYTDHEMGLIVQGMGDRVGIAFTTPDAEALGRASGGVPRNAESLVSMSLDLETTDVGKILEKSRVSPDGLTEMHMRYLQVLSDCGGVAGLEIVCAHLGYAKSTMIDLEKLLVQRGMLEYSKQGRLMIGTSYEELEKWKP